MALPIARPPKAGRTIPLGASSVTIVARGEDTGGAYSLLEFQAQPGGGSGLHTHRAEDEGFYVLEGVFAFELGERAFEAGAGAYVFIPRGLRHAFRNAGETAARALILATPAGLEGFFEGLAGASTPEEIAALAKRYGLEF